MPQFNRRAPSIMYRPDLYQNGQGGTDRWGNDLQFGHHQWCAQYGGCAGNLGVTTWGETPAEAMAAFDQKWMGK